MKLFSNLYVNVKPFPAHIHSSLHPTISKLIKSVGTGSHQSTYPTRGHAYHRFNGFDGFMCPLFSVIHLRKRVPEQEKAQKYNTPIKMIDFSPLDNSKRRDVMLYPSLSPFLFPISLSCCAVYSAVSQHSTSTRTMCCIIMLSALLLLLIKAASVSVRSERDALALDNY